MTEAEAKEIVERYEDLVAVAVRSAGPFNLPAFEVSFPVEMQERAIVVRENIEGDKWRLRSVTISLE